MHLVVWPKPSVALVGWSFSDNLPAPTAIWDGRPAYVVNCVRGLLPTHLLAYFDLQVLCFTDSLLRQPNVMLTILNFEGITNDFFKEPFVWLWFKIHKAQTFYYTLLKVCPSLIVIWSCDLSWAALSKNSIWYFRYFVCTANSRSSTIAESVRHTKDLKLASVFTSQIIVAYSNTKKC